jgi:hypothetical protein
LFTPRVNACYGYITIARIRITQTAATGFAEGQMAFDHGAATPRGPSEKRNLAEFSCPWRMNPCTLALAALGANVITNALDS